MAPKGLLLQIKEKTAEREAYRQRVRDLSAVLVVLRERRRSEVRTRTRAAERAMKVSKGGKLKPKARPLAGRPTRWPGRCLACIYRFAGKRGGQKHMESQCTETKAFIQKNKKRILEHYQT